MPTYIVLLRGINVGKAKRVPMADFKALLLRNGCTAATTLLNSGNAVVAAPRQAPAALARTIATAIADRFGFAVPVIAMTAEAFALVVAGNELAAAKDPARLLVACARDAAALAPLRALAALAVPPERFLLGRHAAYLDCPGGILGSAAAKALLAAGETVTTRNWATVGKLHALVQDRSGAADA